ncbi:hypothetical protein J5X98_04400 [Leptothermofonsia sichuanensis E412]|uniref:hypothetical protein n=1 Tax=Leptothermofonsia sichuanensis TaxID=2917832 RepID=UPI001CA6EDEF|nr:hypothetical protein J5X98_04400 [Leptothermofonsia sichuanensis E412]
MGIDSIERQRRTHARSKSGGYSDCRVHVFNPAIRDRLNWTSDSMEIHILKDGSRLLTVYRGQMNLTE